MVKSAGHLRLASKATRTLSEKALDALGDAVVVVDSRPKHLPVVLANAAARDYLVGGETGAATLAGSSLFGLLGAASASGIESLLASIADGEASLSRSLVWRLAQGEASATTELKLLDASEGQRLVMLSFVPSPAKSDLSSALDQLPLALLIVDGDLTVTYANDAAMHTGGTTENLLGRSALALTPTIALAPAVYRRALQGTRCRHEQVELCVPGAPKRWFDIDVQPLKSASRVTGLAILSKEVEGPRFARGPDQTSQRNLRALIEETHDIVSVAGPDGRLKYVSGGARNALGYSIGDIEWSSYIFDYVHPDDAAVLRLKFGELTAGILGGFTCQHRVRHHDGSYRWLESSYVPALDNPLIQGVVATSRDITERKQAEIRLAQREEVFRLAADAVDGIIFEWDLVGGVVHRSRGVFEILGIEPDELAPVVDSWRERLHPADLEAATRQIGLALIEGRGYTTTYRVRDARGRYRSILERALIQRNAAGDPLRAIGCCVDVSEIKRLTDLLGEAQRTAKMGGWEYSYSALELTWTDEMFHIFETSPERFSVSWESMLAQCTPESRERFSAAWRRADCGDGQLDLELEITTLKGQRIWIRVVGHIEKVDERPIRAYGSVQNIQEHKLAQIALENSTGWLKLSMNMAHMLGWRWDKASDRIDFATEERHRRKVPAAFPSLSTLLERMHPKDRPLFMRALESGFLTCADTTVEFRLKVAKAAYRSFATIARPLFDADGNPRGYVGVTQDVTERRESEAKLRRSERLLRTTTANTADTLLLLDTDLRVRFINRGCVGLRVEDIVGREISVVLPEAARCAVISKLRHVLSSGEPATYEFQSRDGGGEPSYFENRAVLVQDETVGTGLSISVTDITDRKRLEQEILDVSSRERQAIGRDLHDGLGQELTGVALMLRSLATRFQHQCPEGVATLNEIVGVVNQSIESARSLARGLLPVRTEVGGLPFALRELATRGRDLYGLEVNFRAEIWPEITLSETSASHLYRIAQEALTNAARHGHASKVEILLMVTRTTFLLRITDDGVGIRSVGPTSGMGLKIMRYRAGMIGAKIEIGGNKPLGTIVRVTGEQPLRAGALQYGHAIYGGSEYGR
ncbi:MAG TPA: PAS domain S-box protein [Steroidobacteraceae bacterium]|nr:PAS domain S-box protein [Steroidobacteraceae bacterium]